MNTYRIPEMAKKYTEHDMIQKHTDLPLFPEFRTRLLYAFLNKHSTLAGYSELYTLVTSLVQLGLDTHDMVSVTNDAKEQKSARSRQLKVLAGDYFSSRFYYLLSHSGQIDLIGILSAAICEANRLKMNLYLKMKQLKLTADEYIRQSVEVKTQLFLSFANLLEERFYVVWPEVLRLFTRCEVLHQEIVRSESSQPYRDSWGFWHVLQQATREEKKLLQSEEPDAAKWRSLWLKYKVTSQLHQMLDACLKELQDKLQSLEPEKLGKELLSIGEPFRRYLSAPRATQEV
ncbi:heptaprenyl diphosphate synthase component 1 [Paenibacillus ehimensis]|uniref:Heptaprenyl diphosphate synthase component 1 n=1 Tax=Paenibacillus ehimensis TaxID=79264 RepID=A0ABT8VDV7_9BACL|nr:heptaprenyl diphosphate synthase component 1 [Paenibacillus ehimensis]MDO3679176.1 heptaprenyl diphosphate synthase component 1 [Paenibacillus ehimensis]MEC0207745.1 heptaprenyl diphosphate synthase component 1 [Paenibacillus ehimensis]